MVNGGGAADTMVVASLDFAALVVAAAAAIPDQFANEAAGREVGRPHCPVEIVDTVGGRGEWVTTVLHQPFACFKRAITCRPSKGGSGAVNLAVYSA
jgi:hypothetical protein